MLAARKISPELVGQLAGIGIKKTTLSKRTFIIQINFVFDKLWTILT